MLSTQGKICSRCKEAIVLGNSEKNICVGLPQVVLGFDARVLI